LGNLFLCVRVNLGCSAAAGGSAEALREPDGFGRAARAGHTTHATHTHRHAHHAHATINQSIKGPHKARTPHHTQAYSYATLVLVDHDTHTLLHALTTHTLLSRSACGQAVGCGVCDTPELWRGAAGLCARVRACAGAAESLHTYTHHTSRAVLRGGHE